MALPEITVLPDSIKITVTEEHIKDGEPDTRELCPIAWAAWDAFGQTIAAVWVIGNQIIVGRYEGPIPFIMPEEAVEWLFDFDDKGTGEPIEFIAVKDETGIVRW